MSAKKPDAAEPEEGTAPVEFVPLDEVRPHPDNPRKGDVAAIAASIQKFGFKGAIQVQRSTGHILAGNHRWKAMRSLGRTMIPVQYADVDDVTAKAMLLADNRTSDLGGYDDDAIDRLLAGFKDDIALPDCDFSDLMAGLQWDVAELAEQDSKAGGLKEGVAPTKAKTETFTTALVFASQEDLDLWNRFVRMLRKEGYVGETAGERIVSFVKMKAPEIG